MALKRGNLQQLTRDAEVFNGSGRDEPVETPQRATAAQMAGRKIKQPRSRAGGATAAGGSMGMNTGFAGSGAQAAVGAPSFQPPPPSGGFNFSAPTPVNGADVQFGSTNTNGQTANPPNGGYTGTLFSVPSGFGKTSSTDAFGGNSTTQNSNPSTLFNAPSSFNFGGGGTDNNPFSTNNQQPATGFGSSSTSNLFASASSKPAAPAIFGMSSASQTPSLFGSPNPPPTQNLFGQQVSSSQTPSLFAPQASTERSQNEKSSHSNSMMTDDSPTRPVQNNSSSLFSGTQQATTTDPLAQAKTVPPLNLFGTPTQSTTSNIFAATASGNDTQSTNNASNSNIFGAAEQKAPSNLFSFSPAASTSASTAPTGAKTNLFGDLKQSSGSKLFGNSEAGQSTEDAGTSSFSANNNNNIKSSSSAGSLFSNGHLFGSAKDTGTSRSEAGPSQAQNSDALNPPSPASGVKEAEKKEAEGSQKPGFANLFGNSARPTPSSGAQRAANSTREGSTINTAATSMATLNSPAPSAAMEQSYQSISDLVAPPAPDNLSEEERAAWPDVWRCKVLEQLFKRHMKAPGPDGTRGGDPSFLWIMMEFSKTTASLKQRFAARAQTDLSSGRFTRASNPAALFPVQALTPAPATSGGNLFGKPSAPVAKHVAGNNPFASTGSGSSLFTTAAKPDDNPSETTTAAAASSSLFVSDASNKKRKPEETLEKATQDGSLDQAKKSRMDEVSYPTLPDASEPSENAVKAPVTSEPPKFQMPKFGAGSGAASFLSQFGDKADKAQADAAKRRKDEDYDSEEEDLETWQKRDKQQQETKKAEYEAIAKKSTLGFVFKPMGDAGATSSSPFAVKDVSVADKGVQQQPDKTPATSLFAKSAPANAAASTPLFGSSATGTAPGTATQPKPLFSFEPKAPTGQPSTSLFASAKPSSSSSLFASASSSSAPLFASSSSSSVLPTAKQLPSNFTFSASTSAAPGPAISSSIFGSSFMPSASATSKPLGSSLFGSTTPLSQSTGPMGGLFDRISPGQEAAGLKESVTQDNTFKGDASTPIKFSKSLPPSLAPPSLAPPSVTSETSRATTPATGDDTDANAGGDDDAAPKDEQLDLSQTAVGEEDEDVLIELRAKGSEMVKNKDGKADWVVRGVGQLKLLQNKDSKKTRILLRSSPAAKIVLNTQLLPSAKYVTSGPKGNTIRLPVVTGDGKLQQYIIMVKETKDADKLASLMEENKQR